MQTRRIGILSDVHYACAAEQARGGDYELRGIANPVQRWLIHAHRHFIWLRNPLRQGYLLDRFIDSAVPLDHLVANGDYTCDSGFIGLSDLAARQSAQECLGKLRKRFGVNFHGVIGDHELGKRSFGGGNGGMRLESWRVAVHELHLKPCWRVDVGRYSLIGITSSVVALPVFHADTLREEAAEWERVRQAHLAEIRDVFGSLPSDQRILLFCHDPTALPFLKQDPVLAARLGQIEQTFIGHLHTNLVMQASRILGGLPFLWFPGHTGRRMVSALREARHWRDFKVRLCPALAGIELLKDGGYWTVEVQPEAQRPPIYCFHPIPR